MGDDRFIFRIPSIPTVQLHASAPRQKNLSVHFHTRFASELSAREVGIVTRVDVVMW